MGKKMCRIPVCPCIAVSCCCAAFTVSPSCCCIALPYCHAVSCRVALLYRRALLLRHRVAASCCHVTRCAIASPCCVVASNCVSLRHRVTIDVASHCRITLLSRVVASPWCRIVALSHCRVAAPLQTKMRRMATRAHMTLWQR